MSAIVRICGHFLGARVRNRFNSVCDCSILRPPADFRRHGDVPEPHAQRTRRTYRADPAASGPDPGPVRATPRPGHVESQRCWSSTSPPSFSPPRRLCCRSRALPEEICEMRDCRVKILIVSVRCDQIAAQQSEEPPANQPGHSSVTTGVGSCPSQAEPDLPPRGRTAPCR